MDVSVRANPNDWQEENKFQQLNILNDHIWFHKGRQSQIPLAASALFTYLSPSTRHPLAFNCNARQTQLNSVLYRSETDGSYKECLEAYDKDDSVGISANKSTYFLVTSVEDWPRSDTNAIIPNEMPKNTYNHLRTMTHVQFENEDSSVSTKTLVLSNHGVKVTNLDDVNALKFLLGVTPFSQPILDRDSHSPLNIYEMDSILDKLADMPFNDPSLLKIFIRDNLGFDFPQTTEDTPIWLQWTILSFFIQMCSPINFSAIEGGHRTWSIISFFTGRPFLTNADFRNFGAQYQADGITTLGAKCGLMGSFPTHMVFNNNVVGKSGYFGFEESKAVVVVSKNFKTADNTNNKSTRCGFLTLWLIRLREMNLNAGTTEDVFHTPFNYHKEHGIYGELDLINKFNAMVKFAVKLLSEQDPYKTLLGDKDFPEMFDVKDSNDRSLYDTMRSHMVSLICHLYQVLFIFADIFLLLHRIIASPMMLLSRKSTGSTSQQSSTSASYLLCSLACSATSAKPLFR